MMTVLAWTRLYVVTIMAYAGVRNAWLASDYTGRRRCVVRGVLDDLARVAAAPVLWPAYVCYDSGQGARPMHHFQRDDDE